MNAKSWFIASGVGFGLWSLLMTGSWLEGYTGFWFLFNTNMPLFFFDFPSLNLLGWLVIVARFVTLLLWVAVGFSLYKGFKQLKAQPQA
jgi:hypothetical protein